MNGQPRHARRPPSTSTRCGGGSKTWLTSCWDGRWSRRSPPPPGRWVAWPGACSMRPWAALGSVELTPMRGRMSVSSSPCAVAAVQPHALWHHACQAFLSIKRAQLPAPLLAHPSEQRPSRVWPPPAWRRLQLSRTFLSFQAVWQQRPGFAASLVASLLSDLERFSGASPAGSGEPGLPSAGEEGAAAAGAAAGAAAEAAKALGLAPCVLAILEASWQEGPEAEERAAGGPEVLCRAGLGWAGCGLAAHLCAGMAARELPWAESGKPALPPLPSLPGGGMSSCKLPGVCKYSATRCESDPTPSFLSHPPRPAPPCPAAQAQPCGWRAASQQPCSASLPTALGPCRGPLQWLIWHPHWLS